MKSDPDLARTVRSWLRTDENESADRVLDTVLGLLDTTPQRRSWWPTRRFAQMNTFAKIAMAAAAVVVIAVVGVNVTRNGGVVGIAGPSSTPAPTSSPTPTPTPSPSPSPTGAPTLPPPGTALVAGTYRSDFITYTLPTGWETGGTAVILKNGSPTKGDLVIDTWRDIATVYADPCHWQKTPFSGVALPTVDTVVAAFVAQKRSSTVKPVAITIDGHSGKQIDLAVPATIKVASGTNADGGDGVVVGCDGGLYKAWSASDGGDRYNQGPGQHDLLDILDVNGKTYAIRGTYWTNSTAADRAELQGILASIKITP
jgi:hypothetical protein